MGDQKRCRSVFGGKAFFYFIEAVLAISLLLSFLLISPFRFQTTGPEEQCALLTLRYLVESTSGRSLVGRSIYELRAEEWDTNCPSLISGTLCYASPLFDYNQFFLEMNMSIDDNLHLLFSGYKLTLDPISLEAYLFQNSTLLTRVSISSASFLRLIALDGNISAYFDGGSLSYQGGLERGPLRVEVESGTITGVLLTPIEPLYSSCKLSIILRHSQGYFCLYPYCGFSKGVYARAPFTYDSNAFLRRPNSSKSLLVEVIAWLGDRPS